MKKQLWLTFALVFALLLAACAAPAGPAPTSGEAAAPA